jgi:hypothetical protein
MDIQRPFAAAYEVEEVRETSGAERAARKFFPPLSDSTGHDGIILRIRPTKGADWIGSFAFGRFGEGSLTRVATCPNPHQICVVAAGAGYIVHADNPDEWQRVRAQPVCDIRAIVSKRLLVLADFTKLVAYGPNHLAWESPDVSSDGIQLIDASADQIRLAGWDARLNRRTIIAVDPETGSVTDRSE